MKKILVTGGTVFVSRFIAEWYVQKGDTVYVLNRNTRPQPEGVRLICADRRALSNELKDLSFDLVVDTGYSAEDTTALLDALGTYRDYVFISSSAVYPDDAPQPFRETCRLGENRFWGAYGVRKIEAETLLLARNPNAYILRPPYLYGVGNNVYREAMVFDCALADRKFYLPRDGAMQLQFFSVRDLCRVIDSLLAVRPDSHIFNVGNPEGISVRDWVTLCYEIAGKQPEFAEVWEDVPQRNYFCFHDYAYLLDVSQQKECLLPKTIPLREGLTEAYHWYRKNAEQVVKRDYLAYIDRNF